MTIVNKSEDVTLSNYDKHRILSTEINSKLMRILHLIEYKFTISKEEISVFGSEEIEYVYMVQLDYSPHQVPPQPMRGFANHESALIYVENLNRFKKQTIIFLDVFLKETA